MHATVETEEAGPNPAGATLMLVIAFLSFNLSMGAMYGPFSVLIDAIEAKLHVTREVSTLPIPVVTFVMSLFAPVAGTLFARYSLRLLMMGGALMMLAGYVVASIATSAVVFVGAYGLLVAPGLCICGAVAPSTLVTRWYRANRGRALGLAATPALLSLTPLPAVYLLNHYGLSSVYWLFTALMAICFVFMTLVRDNPEGFAPAQAHAPASEGADGGTMTMASLVRDTRFWRLALASGLFNSVVIMFSTQIVPVATDNGIDATRAAGLLTIYLVGTLVGTPLVGTTADRIGGARLISVLCIFFALLQAALVTRPGFAGLAVIAGLCGLQGSAMIPSLGLALSRQFGPANFSKAYGVTTVVGLPFSVAIVPISAAIFVRTHSYSTVFLMASIILALGAVLTLTLREGPTASASKASA